MMEHISSPVSRVLGDRFFARHIEYAYDTPIRRMQAEISMLMAKNFLSASDLARIRRLDESISNKLEQRERTERSWRGIRK